MANFSFGTALGFFFGSSLALVANKIYGSLPSVAILLRPAAPPNVFIPSHSFEQEDYLRQNFGGVSGSEYFAPVYVYPYYGGARSPRERSQEVIDNVVGHQRPFSQVHQDFMVLKLIDLIDHHESGMENRHSLPPKNYGAMIQDIADIVKSSSDAVFRNNTEKRRYFIDLAANDAVRLSNTLLLEAAGWNGLCVEPNSIYWYGLARWRSCTVVGAVVGKDHEVVAMNLASERGGIEMSIRSQNATTFATTVDSDGRIVTAFETTVDKDGEKKIKHSVSMAALFRRFNVPPVIDYFSLDVEGAEKIVMESFPFDEFKSLFMTIERPSSSLTNLLVSKGYIPIVNISLFGETLWMHSSVPIPVGTVRDVAWAYSPEGRTRARWNGGGAFHVEQDRFV